MYNNVCNSCNILGTRSHQECFLYFICIIKFHHTWYSFSPRVFLVIIPFVNFVIFVTCIPPPKYKTKNS
ncbi:hypothetical protein Hanom_Chr05g00440151 [Helianthus anomalus]